MKKLFYLLTVLFILLLYGCSDETNPVEQEEHFEPEGWLIENSAGGIALVVWQGQVQSTWDNNSIPQKFTLNVNDSISLKVRFLDSTKQQISYPAGDEQSLGWITTNPLVINISGNQSDKWSFGIKGLSAGSTTFELRVLHSGHADVKTPLITVDVN